MKYESGDLLEIISNAPGVLFRAEVRNIWVVRFISSSIERITGYPFSHFIDNRYIHYSDLICPEDKPMLRETVGKAVKNQTSYSAEYRLIDSTGVTRWVYEYGVSFYSSADEAFVVDGMLFEITSSKLLELELRKKQNRLLSMIEVSSDYYLFFDSELKLVGRDNKKGNFFPFCREKCKLGTPIEDIITGEDRSRILRGIRSVLSTGRSYQTDLVHTVNNRQYYILLRSFRIEDGIALLISDATELREASIHQKISTEFFYNTIDGLFVTDLDGRLLIVNPAFTALTGYRKEDVLGKLPLLFAEKDSVQVFRRVISGALSANGEWRGKIWFHKKDRSRFPVSVTISGVRDDNGKPLRYVSVFRDITEEKALEERLRRQAFHDSLTGLPNRILLMDRLNRSCELAKRTSRKVAVVFIDLDNFKFVNDTIGHEAGDRYLVKIANTIQACIRRSDTFARLGGDEFVMLLNEIESSDAVIGVVKSVYERLAHPVRIMGKMFFPGASVGISIFPDDSMDPGVLLRNADSAMYESKRKGKNCFHFYSEELNTRLMHRVDLERRLRCAFDDDSFVIVYEPILRFDTGETAGFEVNLEWHDEKLGKVLPEEFMPVADASGLTTEIYRWLLEKASEDYPRLNPQASSGLRLHMNVKASELVASGLAEMLETGLLSGRIQWKPGFEISEASGLCDNIGIREKMADLRRLGCSFFLDGFGEQASALKLIIDCPISGIKIDPRFVRGAAEGRRDSEMIRAMIKLAESLSLDVIACGVETQEEAEFLADCGCRYMQGKRFNLPEASELTIGKQNKTD